MKRIITICGIFLMMLKVNATTYYVSVSGGDDTRTLSQATSTSTPWKSLDKVNSIMGSLVAGDKVLFNRGETFYGKLVINKSGTSTSYITFGAYGTGEKPIISATKLITGWTNVGNIYTSTDVMSPEKWPYIVILNDVIQQIGRWPNSGFLYSNKVGLYNNAGGTLNGFRSNGITTIKDDAWGTYKNKPKTSFDRTDVVYRNTRFTTDIQRVDNGGTWSSSSSQFTSRATKNNSKASDATCYSGFGYYYQNDPAFLDSTGEWYYDTTTNRLKIYLTNNAANFDIKVPIYNVGIKTTDENYLILDNLVVEGADSMGIYVDNGSFVKIINCEVNNVSGCGIYANSSPNLYINNCIVDGSEGTGIYVRPGCDNSEVSYTNVLNNMLHYGMTRNEGITGYALLSQSSGLIDHCYVYNSGGNGISPNNVSNITLQYSRVNICSRLLDDNGAIYISNLTWRNAANPYPPYIFKQFANVVVKNNIVENVIGAGEGTIRSGDAVNGWSQGASDGRGIYYDQGTNHVTTDSNVVYNANGAFFNNDSEDDSWTNNLTYGKTSKQKGMWIQQSKELDDVFRINISNNIFFSETTAFAMDFYTDEVNASGVKTASISKWGTIDNNYYVNPKLTTGNLHYTDGPTSGTATLAQWRTRYPAYDANSALSPVSSSTAVMKYYPNYGDTKITQSLGGRKMQDGKGNIYNGTADIPPHYALALIDIGSSTNNPVNIAPTISLVSNKSSYITPESVTLTASPADQDGTVASVTFYVNGTTALKTLTSAPYTYTYSPSASPSGYKYTAKVIDDQGASTTSSEVAITVKDPTTQVPNSSGVYKFGKIKSFKVTNK